MYVVVFRFIMANQRQPSAVQFADGDNRKRFVIGIFSFPAAYFLCFIEWRTLLYNRIDLHITLKYIFQRLVNSARYARREKFGKRGWNWTRNKIVLGPISVRMPLSRVWLNIQRAVLIQLKINQDWFKWSYIVQNAADLSQNSQTFILVRNNCVICVLYIACPYIHLHIFVFLRGHFHSVISHTQIPISREISWSEVLLVEWLQFLRTWKRIFLICPFHYSTSRDIQTESLIVIL